MAWLLSQMRAYPCLPMCSSLPHVSLHTHTQRRLALVWGDVQASLGGAGLGLAFGLGCAGWLLLLFEQPVAETWVLLVTSFSCFLVSDQVGEVSHFLLFHLGVKAGLAVSGVCAERQAAPSQPKLG